MKDDKSTLKKRMDSEGFGEISFQEGIELPEYSEEYVENPNKEEKTEKSEELSGGLADNKTVESIAQKHNVSTDKIETELTRGIEVEYEHTSDKGKAKEIALDHLMEISDYYTRLDKMEKEAKKD